MTRWALLVVLVAILLLGVVSDSMASPQFQQVVQLRLSAARTAAPTSLDLVLRIEDPGEPWGRPADKVTVQLPAGSAYNARGASHCQPAATIEETMCPPGSLLGGKPSGHYFEYAGLPVPTGWSCDGGAQYMHRKGGLIMNFVSAICPPGIIPGHVLFDGSVSKKGLFTVDLPRLGPPEHPLPLQFWRLHIRRSVRQGVPLLRTPKTCNPRKDWRARTTVSYEDGSRESTTTRLNCRPRE
jgi:hypothetical protein